MQNNALSVTAELVYILKYMSHILIESLVLFSIDRAASSGGKTAVRLLCLVQI